MGASESKVAPTSLQHPPAIKREAKTTTGNKLVLTNRVAEENASVISSVKPKAKDVNVRLNDYELAIKSCKELEFILETEFGSSGSSLHEMITNANASLPIELIMNMRYVATIGNNLVHEKSFSHIPDQEEFVKRYDRSIKALQEIAQQRRLVEARVVESKRKKREAEIQEALMNEDREWLNRQQREMAAQKARRLELEKEKELLEQKRRELEAQQKSSMTCACF